MPTLSANDIEVFHETFGDPADPALLMVCGLGTQSVGYDDELCETVAALGLHVIRFDNRDTGLSSWFDGSIEDPQVAVATAFAGDEVDAPYTLSDMAADAVGLLDALGVDRAHVVGASMGGMIAQTMAIEHPERVRSLTSVMSTTGEREVGGADPNCLAGLVAIMAPAHTRDARVTAGIELQKLIGTQSQWDPERVRKRVEMFVDRAYNPEGTTRQLLAVMVSGSRAEGLTGLDVPTMVLHGDEDPLVHLSGGQRTAELIPGAELRVLAGMGHDLPPAYWDEVVAAVASLVGRS